MKEVLLILLLLSSVLAETDSEEVDPDFWGLPPVDVGPHFSSGDGEQFDSEKDSNSALYEEELRLCWRVRQSHMPLVRCLKYLKQQGYLSLPTNHPQVNADVQS